MGHSNREKIYDFIKQYPGVHFRKIVKELHISVSTLRYHLIYLEKKSLIIKQRDQGYARYYCSNQLSREQKKIIPYLRHNYSREVLLFLLLNACGSLNEMSKVLNKDIKNLSAHLKKLLKDEIIELTIVKNGIAKTPFKKCNLIEYNSSNREIVYRLKEPYKIYDLIREKKQMFLDDGTTKAIIEYLEELSKETKYRPRQMKATKNDVDVDRVINHLFEIFPNPYSC